MKRLSHLKLFPRSLQGQMLLTVALALLVAQGIGAGLAWRVQAERERNATVHALAFRLIGHDRAEMRRPGFERRDFARRTAGRRFARIREMPQMPAHGDEQRLPLIEQQLGEVLAEQGVAVDTLEVFEFAITHPMAERDFARRMHRARALPDTITVAALRRPGADNWLVASTLARPREPHFLRNLIAQTLLIYIVLIGAIALILRRITGPLAALTRRVEQFARDPAASPDARVVPQGPRDTRALIEAHNAMETRIAAMLDEKDVMLGAIGHDLKTPLAALRVRIESVDDETERSRMATTIEDIVRTLDDILSLARVGRPSDPREPTELSALVASVVEEFEDMGEPVELGDTTRIVAPLRATWLRRAVRNLVSNALRYAGGATVTVTRENGEAVIRVEDEGPGIPESDIARMLEPFERGDPSRNRETGGAGIGLTLARAIAEQHGGSLVLANRAEGGLRAEIRLRV